MFWQGTHSLFLQHFRILLLQAVRLGVARMFQAVKGTSKLKKDQPNL